MSKSLSIFSSEFITNLLPDNISDKLSQLGSLNLFEIVFPWAVFFVIFSIAMYLLRIQKNHIVRTSLYFVILYSFFRVCFFENPASWMLYKRLLTWQEIGFREVTVIDQNLRRFIVPPGDLEYLAIGSSQTGAIYSEYASSHRNFYKIEYSGMGPLDYYLYAEFIKKIKPKTLLLYLSGFDFGREISTETMIYAPSQSLLNHYFLINTLGKEIGLSKAIHLSAKMLFADFLPEYKNQFLFKGLRDKLLRKHLLLKTEEQRFLKKSNNEKMIEQVNILRRTLSEKPVELNFYIFERFLSSMVESGIKLVIVEGQYHPDAYSEKNLALERIVSERMMNLSKKYNFIYIPKDKLPALTSADFTDGYHINKTGSDKIIVNLLPAIIQQTH